MRLATLHELHMWYLACAHLMLDQIRCVFCIVAFGVFGMFSMEVFFVLDSSVAGLGGCRRTCVDMLGTPMR